MIRVSPDILQIKPYVPGKSLSELEREFGISGSIKMASNENPLGPSKRAMKAIREVLKEIQRYPDGGGLELRDALASKWKVKQAEVMIGNGSNEIIELLVRTFIMPGDEAIMARPTFSLYRLMVQAGHGKVIEIPLKEGVHDLIGIAKAVTDKTRLIFICNPNNPTGTIVRKKEVRTFLSSIPKQVLVVFDEAYAEYVSDLEYPDTPKLLQEGASLIMLRTFSKIYGLAGLRIGYGISHQEVIGYMNRVRQPFNSNLPGQVGALAALSDESHFSRSRDLNRRGKHYLCKQFNAMGISYLPSETNFIYFFLKREDASIGEKVYRALLEKGVIIRFFGESFFRVTISLPRENRRFISALRDTLSGMA